MLLEDTAQFNKTEESIFTLLALTTQITQCYDSIYENENVLNADFEINSNYRDLIDDNIYDALASQIILKTVAYLDEWNRYFGVRTEPEDLEKIKRIKKMAKPAYDCIKEWKDLNKYRNHILAHNHRENGKQNVFLNSLKYNIPASNGELLLLCFCVQKMSQVVAVFYQEEVITLTGVLYSRIQKRKMENGGEKNISIDVAKK